MCLVLASHCLPSETRAENLVEAYGRRLQAYYPIQTALQKYTASNALLTVQSMGHGRSGTSVCTIITLCFEFSKQWSSIVQD